MEQKQKSHIRPIVIVMIFVFITIGYAYLTSSLSINGSTLLKKPTWDVHFENIQVKDGSVSGEQVIDEPEIDSEQTTVTFHVNLKLPGDYYEFTVDAINAGTIDAMIDNYSDLELTAAQQAYLETSVTYEDGEEIAEKQQLLAGDTAVYKVRVAYKLDLEADDLPSNPDQLDLEFSVEFVQRDDSAIRRRAENSLYNVLKDAAEVGTYAEQFTGSHQDSMDVSLSTKNIYHWKSNSRNYNTVNNMRYVIFADYCWQIIRTTDTGGVKIIYTGKAIDGKCNVSSVNVSYKGSTTSTLSSNYWYGSDYIFDSATNKFSISGDTAQKIWNNSTYSDLLGSYTCKSTSKTSSCTTLYYVDSYVDSTTANVISIGTYNSATKHIGIVKYNNNSNSLAYVGYMYNKDYKNYSIDLHEQEDLLEEHVIFSSYYFSDTYDYNNLNPNKYQLVDPYLASSVGSYSNLVGKYTFFESNSASVGTKIYYIVGYSGSYLYCISLSDGNSLSYYNDTYSFGDSYTDNGNGTYTINNPITINRLDWFNRYTNCNSKYICLDGNNSLCNSVSYVYGTDKTTFYTEEVNNAYKYSNSFTYSNGTYKLVSPTTSFDILSQNSLSMIQNNHYTCWNTSGECTDIAYIYYQSPKTQSDFRLQTYYVLLNNGVDIDQAFNEMLYDENVNTKSSTIKNAIDAWYKKYLLSYDSYIEDTVFCNERAIDEKNGWDKNGGNITSPLSFKYYNYSYPRSLTCEHETDRFSISNNKAKLTYKVGMISSIEHEMGYYMLGDINTMFWTMTPNLIGKMYYVDFDEGYIFHYGEPVGGSDYGVRPVISLKPGTLYSSGDGSMANPYVVSTN